MSSPETSSSLPRAHQALQGIGLALIAFALFSAHDVLVKILGDAYAVTQILFFSSLFSFVPMTLVMSTDKQVDNFRPHNLPLVLLRAALNVISITAAFYAFTVLPLTKVYALIFMMPLLITVLAVPILGETIRWQRGLAVSVGLVGVLIVLRPGIQELTLGHLAALTCAVSGAFGALIVRKLGRSERSAVIVLYPMFAGILAMAAMQPFVYKPVALVDLVLMSIVGFIAIAGQFLIVAAYRRAPAAVVAPMQYTQIIWATLFGTWLFGETPDKWVVVGAAIVISSGVFIVWRESRDNVSDVNPILRTPNIRPDTGPSPQPKLFQRMRPRPLETPDQKKRKKFGKRSSFS